MSQTNTNTKLQILLLLSLVLIFVWSLVDCFDLFTWALEAAPVVIGVGILALVYRKFRMSNLACILIWLHTIILLIGAHYTYARMPLFDWIAETFELSRNHYDRLGHFAQGFVPAIIVRELLLRNSPLQKGKWLFFIVVCICMAISAAYELIEWLTAVAAQDGAASFLGTQGDVWDTQKDMALCLVGAIISLLTLGRLHDKMLHTYTLKQV